MSARQIGQSKKIAQAYACTLAAFFSIASDARADDHVQAQNVYPTAAGRLTLHVTDRGYQGNHDYLCPAVLIASDVAVAPAHCFAWAWTPPGRAPLAATATVDFVDADGVQHSARVVSHVSHPDYPFISCLDDPTSEPCRKAFAWCGEHFGLIFGKKSQCLQQAWFIASAFSDRVRADLAVMVLDRELDGIAPMAVAADSPAWLAHAPRVDVLVRGLWWENPASATWESLSFATQDPARPDFALGSLTGGGRYDGEVGLAAAPAPADGAPLLLGLPSHFGPLDPSGSRVADTFVYTPLGPYIRWIEAEMEAAAGQRVAGGRASRLKVVSPEAPAPSPAPEPAPAPRPAPPPPGPSPSPAPAPKPSPAPRPAPPSRPSPSPTPTPTPTPAPEPSPSPSPCPAPAPMPEPEPEPAPAPAPGLEPAPAPTPGADADPMPSSSREDANTPSLPAGGCMNVTATPAAGGLLVAILVRWRGRRGRRGACPPVKK